VCRVDAMYSFFIQWSPNVTGDGEVDVNDRGFVVLRSADSGAPTTDSTELPPTNHPGREWHVRSSLIICVDALLPSIAAIHSDMKLGCCRETALCSVLFRHVLTHKKQPKVAPLQPCTLFHTLCIGCSSGFLS